MATTEQPTDDGAAAVAAAMAAALALAALALPLGRQPQRACRCPAALPVGISSLLASTATGAASRPWHRRVRRRARRRPRSPGSRRLGPGRPADAARPARARRRARSASMQAAVQPAPPTTSTRTSRSSSSTPPHPTRWAPAPPRAAGLHRQGRDRRRRRLRLRRQPPRPRRPRRPQRQAVQRRVRQRAARREQPDRRRRTRPARTRTPTSAAATAPTSPGIIAADSTTDPAGGRFGVAPDADLVCYSIGEVLFTTAVVTAYDHMLDQPDLWGIDVVNNSWGNSFRQFDPRDPVAVVTKAVADLGVTVVFAAGNSGCEDAEMSLNPFSRGAVGDLGRRRLARPPSGRLLVERPRLRQLAADARSAAAATPSWTGDRIGVYHPDVTAPGVDISLDLRHGRHRHRAVPAAELRQRHGRRARAWPRRTSPARPRSCSRPTRR